MVYGLPHILVPGEPTTDRFQPRGGGDGGHGTREIPNRQAHAAALRQGLAGAVEAAQDARDQWTEELRADGIILSVVGWAGGFELALESLDLRGSNIELLSVKPSIGDPPSAELATVFVPDTQLGQFFGRLDRYATEETAKGTPGHEKLVANISTLQRATLEQLWTDHRPFPGEGTGWWEIWLRRTGDELETLAQVAAGADWELAARAVEFPLRAVTAVRADLAGLGSSLASRLPIAEVRFAGLVESIAELPPETQREWVQEALDLVVPAPEHAPAVCLLDTGVYQHSLFSGSLDVGDVLHVVGPDGHDRDGHRTAMGGLALFGDVAGVMTSGLNVHLNHRLESVKVGTPRVHGQLRDPGSTCWSQAGGPDHDRVRPGWCPPPTQVASGQSQHCTRTGSAPRGLHRRDVRPQVGA